MGLKNITRSAIVNFAKVVGLDDLFLTGQEHPAFLGGGGREAIAGVDNAYSSSWIAYACIAKQAKDISGAPLLVLRDPDDAESTVSDNDRLARLIYNPHPGMTHNQMLQYMVTMLRLRGAFFLDFDAPGRAASRVIPWRDPLYWKPIVNDQTETVVAWEYRKGSKNFQRLPSEVVVGRQIDPTDPWGWQSPLAAAANPLKIDRDGDKLNARTIEKGGESGTIYKTTGWLGEQKYNQLLTKLQSRQNGPGEPQRPMILEGGLEIVDPKFTKQDLQILQQQEKSVEKICAVYGMTPSLLFKDDSPNRATFETRRRIYWSETLIPIMNHIEDALDQWTVETFGLYCRFDLSAVTALRDDLLDQVKVAKVLHSMQIPVAAINDRLDLGLDLDLIPGAESSLVASTLVPVSAIVDADYSAPAETDTPEKTPENLTSKTAPASFRLTNKLIRERHKDAVAVIARGKYRTAIEVRAGKSYKAEMLKWRSKAVKAADAAQGDVGALRTALNAMRADMGKGMVSALAEFHREAAVEGAISILDLVSEQRFYGTENERIFRKAPELPDEAVRAIRDRQNYLETFKSGQIIDTLMDDIERAVTAEYADTAGQVSESTLDQLIKQKVRHKFNTEVNYASMIGRTEVGTAFNAARFGQMKSQQFEQHEWLTAGDELVRGGDPADAFSHIDCDGEVRQVGREFPNRLTYPQENGGEPGNTINCRCLTIPVVQE